MYHHCIPAAQPKQELHMQAAKYLRFESGVFLFGMIPLPTLVIHYKSVSVLWQESKREDVKRFKHRHPRLLPPCIDEVNKPAALCSCLNCKSEYKTMIWDGFNLWGFLLLLLPLLRIQPSIWFSLFASSYQMSWRTGWDRHMLCIIKY